MRPVRGRGSRRRSCGYAGAASRSSGVALPGAVRARAPLMPPAVGAAVSTLVAPQVEPMDTT
eukprot:8596717-Lingulodinium_polyedra.AAC.1